MATVVELSNQHTVQWCPGCGDYGILTAFKAAISELGINPKDVVTVSGIGCFGKLPHYVNTYGVETLHGRALPVAQGVKLANRDLTVVAFLGDGDGYGIGYGHFVHACRKNSDILAIAHHNEVYGLTTGQTSPTSPKGWITKTTPNGNLDIPVNPLAVAIVSGATFVARGYAGDIKHLTSLIVAGIKHKGFAVLDVLQPCVSFNPLHSYQWYQQRIEKLDDSNHDKRDFLKAVAKASEIGEKIPIGIFYEAEEMPTLEDQLPQMKEKPIVKHDISNIDISDLLEKYI